ncbi:hypothetical protein BDZ89DRAFT_1240632 [Hymenopellis radicata]|nr:hypothetical protein BDZ89DRAFT_1240632 [Hymenopellis radicata]
MHDDGPVEALSPIQPHPLPADINTQDVIDVEALPDLPKPKRQRTYPCSGYLLTFPPGMTPHLDYSFPLHHRLAVPWGYEWRQGRFILRANTCLETVRKSETSCPACLAIKDDPSLGSIIQRRDNGVHESTNLDFYTHRQLVERFNQKERQVNTLKLEGLNQRKMVQGKVGALDNNKRLLVAIRSGSVEGVERILRAGYKRGLGARGILALYERAAEGAYRPQSYEESDFLRGILFWRIGGGRLASMAHRCLNQIPSLSVIRRNSTMARLKASHGKPTTAEIESNLSAVLGSDELQISRQESGFVQHVVAMFDEISVEKRIRWDDVDNCFLGPCRNHGGKVSLAFNSMEDLVELFRSLDSGEIHYSSEATVGALGILTNNKRVYGARPVLISGTCKRETGHEHARVLTTVMDAITNTKSRTNLRIVSIASDGETRRGSALFEMTCKIPLSPSSPLFNLLDPLVLLNLLVGDDDVTADKDYKHIIKRLRNLLLRKRGIHILDRHITPSIIKKHLRLNGATSEHIQSLFKPDDKQDVPLAYQLMRDLWALPPLVSGNLEDVETRNALRIFGKFAKYLIFPYICVDLSLSLQLQYLSAAVHVAIIMFRQSGPSFIPSLLYMDIMIMIKNVIFCVAKGKVDDPDGKFWIILLGTDRLETLFGILRTIIGTDANVDELQLLQRLTGTVEVSNILIQKPEWDSRPRRLKLPAVDKDGVVIDSKVDHINPGAWRGDVSLAGVSFLTCWRGGRRLVQDELPELAPYLTLLDEDTRDIDMFSPLGKLLFDQPLAPDDNEDDDPDDEEDTTTAVNPAATSVMIDLEDDLVEMEVTPTPNGFERSVMMDGKNINKARAIKIYSEHRTFATSTDRLKRVQGIPRFNVTEYIDSETATPVLEPGDTIATLLLCEDHLFLCLGAVTDISIGTSSADYVELDVLSEDGVFITFQIINLVRATVEDDATSTHDWRTRQREKPDTFRISGQFVQPVTLTLAVPPTGKTFWPVDSNTLLELARDLLRRVNSSPLSLASRKNTIIPSAKRTREFPYREESVGKVCFNCELDSQQQRHADGLFCSFCSKPSVPFDLTQPKMILTHIGSHILHGGLTGERCGMCGALAPQCQYFLTKGANPQVDRERTHGCPVFDSLETRGFRYATAAQSIASNPCSNVPIRCQICTRQNPKAAAIWKYTAKAHYMSKHPTADLNLYKSDWELSKSEEAAMKKEYRERAKKSKPKKNRAKEKSKKEIGELVISQAHSTRTTQR